MDNYDLDTADNIETVMDAMLDLVEHEEYYVIMGSKEGPALIMSNMLGEDIMVPLEMVINYGYNKLKETETKDW